MIFELLLDIQDPRRTHDQIFIGDMYHPSCKRIILFSKKLPDLILISEMYIRPYFNFSKNYT